MTSVEAPIEPGSGRPARWALLPASVSRQSLDRLRPALKKELRPLFAATGVRYRLVGDRVEVRADPTDMIYARSLRTGTGGLRADVASILERDTVGLDIRPGLSAFLEKHRAHQVTGVPDMVRVQLELLLCDDPVGELAAMAERDDLGLYRLGMHNRGWMRLGFWRLLDQLIDAHDPAAITTIASDRDSTINGLLETSPGALVCAPLMARFQPLAAVVELPNMAQVAIVAERGAGFPREMHLPSWPVGAAQARLHGSGVGLYAGAPKTFPVGDVEAMLQALVAGSNSLVGGLTDPLRWVGAGGVVDLDERKIAWASLQFGVDALASLGAEWGSRDSLWSAFRALGILHGVWEGSRTRSVPFTELFDPERLRTHVLPVIPVGSFRDWGHAVVRNYEASLDRAFPTRAAALEAVLQVRNLVHGVGAHSKVRAARLNALQAVGEGQPALQLLADVAALWWTGVILDPERMFRPGVTPW